MRGIGLRHRPQRKPNGITKTDKLSSAYEVATTDYSFTEQLSFTLQEETAKYGVPEKPKEKVSEVAKFVASYASRSVMNLSRQVKTYDAVHDEETRVFVKKTVITETMRQFSEMDLKKEELEVAVEKTIETCVQALTNRVIPIPQTVVQPFTEVKQRFTEFSLDTRSLNWHPSDDTLLGMELQLPSILNAWLWRNVIRWKMKSSALSSSMTMWTMPPAPICCIR